MLQEIFSVMWCGVFINDIYYEYRYSNVLMFVMGPKPDLSPNSGAFTMRQNTKST